MHHFTFKPVIGDQEGLPQIGLALTEGMARAGLSFDLVPHRIVGELTGHTASLVRLCGTGPIVSYSDCISEGRIADHDVTFTMWETNKIPVQWVTNFNKRRAIVVPCEWNRDTFTACGVNVPIHKCRLGVDTGVFSPVKELNGTEKTTFTFGCGGQHYGKNWSRKNLPLVLEAFRQVEGDNLRLEVKCGGTKRLDTDDPRVTFNQDFLSPSELASWFRSLDCFVSAASTEGWGLMQHQALSCGVPLIAVNYGGLAEFFRPPNDGWELDYTIEHPSAFYKGCGKWPMPTLLSLIGVMEAASSPAWASSVPVQTLRTQSSASSLSTELMQGRFIEILADVLA